MEIIPGLFLGNSIDSEKMMHVDLMVNCTQNLPFFPDTGRNIRIPVQDNGEHEEVVRLAHILADLVILRDIKATLERRQIVLVHCKMGQQRSAAVVAAYLMFAHLLTPSDAITFVRSRKPDAFFQRANFEGALIILREQMCSDSVTSCVPRQT